MKIKFKLRNEEGLHCRFCKAKRPIFNLYETSPQRGIVCEYCKEHLEAYSDTTENMK